MKQFIYTVIFIGIALITNATALSTQESVEMADTFREEGKIYVLTAIILIIFLGFFLYAMRIDKKISKLEKELDHKSTSN